MLPFRHSLSYAASADAETFADRVETACRVVERAFAGETLRLARPFKRGDPDFVVADRHKYFRQRARTKLRWFALSNGKAIRGGGDGTWTDEGELAIGGSMNDPKLGVLGVGVAFPDAPWALCEKLLAELGDILGAYYAAVLPPGNERLWATQFDARGSAQDPTLRERGIPRLRLTTYGGAVAAAQPMYLGWLNYWSPATCAFLSFPDDTRHAALLTHSYRTPAGAWIVKLTPDPLDTRRPDHVEILAAAYRQVPRVGVREEGPRPA
jgi:hypothetical protein